ncbi:hypothetical protein [Rhodococcus sp. NPDC057529]|uniref:hypothetical protein n=1 Tax=Rhodococcus sp. NPDC057529 TaxID=3346158 RepID=UPI00366BA43F
MYRNAYLIDPNASFAAIDEVLDYFPGPGGAVYAHVQLASGARVEAAAQDITLTVPIPLVSNAA